MKCKWSVLASPGKLWACHTLVTCWGAAPTCHLVKQYGVLPSWPLLCDVSDLQSGIHVGWIKVYTNCRHNCFQSHIIGYLTWLSPMMYLTWPWLSWQGLSVSQTLLIWHPLVINENNTVKGKEKMEVHRYTFISVCTEKKDKIHERSIKDFLSAKFHWLYLHSLKRDSLFLDDYIMLPSQT